MGMQKWKKENSPQLVQVEFPIHVSSQ